MTLRQIVDAAGMSHETVRRDPRSDESTSTDVKVAPERVVGNDGKHRPTKYKLRMMLAKSGRPLGVSVDVATVQWTGSVGQNSSRITSGSLARTRARTSSLAASPRVKSIQ
jgi:hypothetical protein